MFDLRLAPASLVCPAGAFRIAIFWMAMPIQNSPTRMLLAKIADDT